MLIDFLESKAYFNMQNGAATSLLSEMTTVSIIPMIISILLVGMVYDLVGRRITIVFNLLSIGAAWIYLP